MSTKIDLRYWLKKYEENYHVATGGVYPIFVDEHDVEHEERSPYFNTMSEVLQKRGFLHKREFVSIGKWKTPRQMRNYEENSEGKVRSITSNAMASSSEEKVIRTIAKLKGVGTPVASAILTVIYPTMYGIIDFRAWRALLWISNSLKRVDASYEKYSAFLDSYTSYATFGRYMSYLSAIRKIAANYKMTPRQVDMALWKFDDMKGRRLEE